MNKKLMLGMAAFCAMGLTGGAWARRLRHRCGSQGDARKSRYRGQGG